MKEKLGLILAVALLLIIGDVIFGPRDACADAQSSRDTTKQSNDEELFDPAEALLEGKKVIVILPEKQQLIGVKTTEVTFSPLTKIIDAVGRVAYDERKMATVNLRFEGWVEKLYADYVGKPVKKGEVLAEIYSPEYLSAQMEFVNLLAWQHEKGHRLQRNIEFAWGDRFGTTGKLLTFDVEALLGVARQKLELWEVPEPVILRLEKERKTTKLFPVKSPLNGYVTDKPAVAGKKVAPGERLFDIADLSTVWVIADIFDYELPYLRVGDKATISLGYLRDGIFEADVDYIYPVLSDSTRSAKVRFVLANTEGNIKPAMFSRIEIAVSLGETLAVPESAVIDTGVRRLVYVDQGRGFFEQREVKTGRSAQRMVEIVAGLRAGDRVVSSATFLVDSETKLQQTGKRGCCAP